METKQIKTVQLTSIFFDEELYPRSVASWQTAYDYAQSMLTGAVFPPITLANYEGKLFLVDGKHRIDARKLNKETTIEAEIFEGWSKEKILEEAIKRNIAHGRVFSPYEKRRLALKLRGMKYPENEISQLIQVPLDKLETFVGQRLINMLTGKEIVKTEIKHLAGQDVEQNITDIQKAMYSKSQVGMLKELIKLLENKLIDVEHEEVSELLNRLKVLLN